MTKRFPSECMYIIYNINTGEHVYYHFGALKLIDGIPMTELSQRRLTDLIRHNPDKFVCTPYHEWNRMLVGTVIRFKKEDAPQMLFDD